jgi:hypothetical protein
MYNDIIYIRIVIWYRIVGWDSEWDENISECINVII